MLILLPPSEGKTSPTAGSTLDLDSLYLPELARPRSEVIEDLIETSAGGPQAISAPPSTVGQVEANTRLWQAPTGPASSVYTGVLYAAAGLDVVDREAWTRAQQHVRIASTVFGFLRPGDPIPAYRLPPAAMLPSVGAPLTHLAKQVGPLMESEEPGLVLDSRSGPYLRLWRPTCPWVHVKAIEIRDGRPVVVSHFAKHHRGVLTNHLLTRPSPMPAGLDEILAAAGELVGTEYRRVDLVKGGPGTHVLELTLL